MESYIYKFLNLQRHLSSIKWAVMLQFKTSYKNMYSQQGLHRETGTLRVRLKGPVVEVDKVKLKDSLNITTGQAHGGACMDLGARGAFLLHLETSQEEEEEVDPLVEADQSEEVDPFLEGDQFQEEDLMEEVEQVPMRSSDLYFECIFQKKLDHD